MKIAITGNLGFVGQETEKLFKERGLEVVGYDVMKKRDIRDYNQLDSFIREHNPDRILHLAAIARFAEADKDPKLAFETNVQGTRNVSIAASNFHIPLVYASTGSVYMPIKKDPPITEDFPAMGNSVYGCTKHVGELFVMAGTSPWIVLRYAHLYGKEKRGHGLIGGFLERINRGLAPMLYGGTQSNDFTYIKDVAEANYLAVTAPWDSRWNQIYNIGTGEELSAEYAGRMVCEAFGYKGEIEKREMRTVDPERFVYNVDKAEKLLGFKAQYDFKNGLIDMFKKINGK